MWTHTCHTHAHTHKFKDERLKHLWMVTTKCVWPNTGYLQNKVLGTSKCIYRIHFCFLSQVTYPGGPRANFFFFPLVMTVIFLPGDYSPIATCLVY